MKSLAEREAFRAKQKANEEKERKASNVVQTSAPNAEENKTAEDSFDAADWLNDTVENVNGNLEGLTDDELSAVEQAEAKGKKRAGVTAAIKKEKDKRVNSDTGWNPHNA